MKAFIIGLIAVIVIAGGGYLIFHKPAKTTNSNTTTSKTTNAPAVNNSILTTKSDPSLGQYLADPSGKPLYTYGADTSGVSNCTGSCLATWPAYVDKGSTTGLPAGVSTIKRTDNGQIQFTFNGLPLYYFISDNSGAPTGNGVSNFTLAKPAAATSSQSSSNPSMSSPSNTSAPSSNSSSGYPY